MRVCHFEDRRAAGLGPPALTRPVSDLLCGLTSLGDKQRRHFAADTFGHLCRPALAEAVRDSGPEASANDPIWLRSAPAVLVNGRWLPPTRPARFPAPSFAELYGDGPFVALCEGEPAYAVLDPHHLSGVSPETVDECLDVWRRALPAREVGGRMIRYPWDLVSRNAEQIARDFEAGGEAPSAGFRPRDFHAVGPADRLLVDPAARIDPLVVADTTGGPVVIGPGAFVAAFTRLEGPCSVGPGTHVLGARVRAGTTLGPHCRIGGEVECSIVQGHANKYHDGFLGHSYVGEWVNLAAGTSTGDLRNDYGPISVTSNGESIDTGEMKVGSFIGDHARTGLNVLLDCGTSIGAFAHVLPTGRLAPREIPPFSRFGPSGLKVESDVERMLTTADTAMRSRGRELTPALEDLYRAVAADRMGRPMAGFVPRLRRSA